MPAYGRHMLECQPLAGTLACAGLTTALWANPENCVTNRHTNTHSVHSIFKDENDRLKNWNIVKNY